MAIEIDHTLAEALPAACGNPGNLTVVEGDVLSADLAGFAKGAPASASALAGNVPYYITAPILRAAFAARRQFRSATFLMQREVALRTVAIGGGRDFGLLSCLCQLHSRPRLLFTVPPAAFSPPPSVQSAAVRFDLRREDPPDGLIPFLKACFAAPRKILKNNLAGRYPGPALSADPNAGKRAQQVGFEGLRQMWERLEASSLSARPRAARSGVPTG